MGIANMVLKQTGNPMQKTVDYWLEEGDEALKVAEHLFEKKDYSYSLFFGHLAVEKILKAIYVQKNGEHAPQIHNLVRLAQQAGLSLNAEQIDSLNKITVLIWNQDILMKNEAFVLSAPNNSPQWS